MILNRGGDMCYPDTLSMIDLPVLIGIPRAAYFLEHELDVDVI